MLVERAVTTGAFAINTQWDYNLEGSAIEQPEKGINLSFSAGTSNALFGNSTGNQVASLRVPAIIKI